MNHEYLKSIAEAIDAQAESVEEHAKSEDGCEAEYAQSFGYGDGEIETDRLEDDAAELVAELKILLPNKKSFRDVIQECCELNLEGIYATANEVFSMALGEIESQLDDELAKQVKALTEEEREYVRKQCNSAYLGKSDCIYIGCSYDRWVMNLDVEKLEERVEAIRKTVKKNGKTPEQLRATFKLLNGGAA